jgi:hypothetical protein
MFRKRANTAKRIQESAFTGFSYVAGPEVTLASLGRIKAVQAAIPKVCRLALSQMYPEKLIHIESDREALQLSRICWRKLTYHDASLPAVRLAAS